MTLDRRQKFAFARAESDRPEIINMLINSILPCTVWHQSALSKTRCLNNNIMPCAVWRHNVLSKTRCLINNILMGMIMLLPSKINSSPHGQNGRHFPEDMFKCIFKNVKSCTLIRCQVMACLKTVKCIL